MNTQVYYYVFGILFLAAFIFSLMEILRSSYTLSAKILWILVCLFMPILGSILFFFYRKG
ncbi:PLDc N-terminal domain-containing protein [Kaistella palustris]|uniref:PLDc N-terminal domain-containing protein n=1 Tax=Kaistella palustris TaxID=493376 RepID=UPI00040A3B17|nr:PLDc N-terminal domain-containing protein [Kaistella palustris]